MSTRWSAPPENPTWRQQLAFGLALLFVIVAFHALPQWLIGLLGAGS